MVGAPRRGRWMVVVSVSVRRVDEPRSGAPGDENAAVPAGRADPLIELLHRRATASAAAGEWARAELAWLRVLAIAEETGDRRRFEDTLPLLGATYRAWGRPHRTVDVLLELAAARERDGDPVGHADALASVGRTMTEALRPDAAITYLARAEKELAGLGDRATAHPAVARLHASVLEDLARAHVARGTINTARTLLRQALTLVVDVDEEAAERVRARRAALPKARPGPAQRGVGSSRDRSGGDTRPS
jgi:tetratricopeptide (TPR) repeat protein